MLVTERPFGRWSRKSRPAIAVFLEDGLKDGLCWGKSVFC